MLKNILISVAAITLISGAAAQQKQQATLRKAVAPQYAGTFSPTTGFTSSGGNHRNCPGGGDIINNTIHTNYYEYPGQDQEFIDNNILTDTDGTGFEAVSGMTYSYCSEDPTLGGISEIITIYDESVYCTGPTNWPTSDCSYQITGIPGGDPSGSLACWTITVDLTGNECNLTDGHGGSAGWGQIWDNSLSGHFNAMGGNGQTNSFTWFDWTAPSGSEFQGCYWYGGGPRWAGFDMKMFSADTGDLTLSTTGAPGGTMTFDVSCATPNERVALMYALGQGSHNVYNSETKNWVTTGLANAGFTLADISLSDGAGNYSYSTYVPGVAAGVISVQAADAWTDRLSNIINL